MICLRMIGIVLHSVIILQIVQITTASLKVTNKERVRESESFHVLGHSLYSDALFTTWADLKQHSPIVRESESFRVLGHSLYSDDLFATWADLHFQPTRVGLTCSPERPREACGQHLVCHKRLCMHCQSDRECGRNSFCQKEITGKNMCVKERAHVWTEVTRDHYELLCSILVFVASLLSAAAGLGGGGVFVPLLILFSGLAPSDAVPLSQVMILCGSLVNLSVFVRQRHPEHPDQAKIDYNCVALFQPMLVAGVTLGVLINKLSPNWIIIVLLLITLLIAMWRSSLKAMQQYRKEQTQAEPSPRETDQSSQMSEDSWQNFFWLTNVNFRPISSIVFTWIAMLAASLHNLSVCSYRYAWYLVGVIAAMGLMTYLVNIYVINKSTESDPYDDELSPAQVPDQKTDRWLTNRSTWKGSQYGTLGALVYALISFSAGLLGGLLGLGGGIILGPILLELGLHSEAVQATTALFVFISSSLATIQYALLSVEVYIWHYTLWYASITTVATVIGQWACNAYVRKSRKYSLITFSMVAVIAFSALALGIVGGLQIYQDYKAGSQMGFSSERLCNAKGIGIVASESTMVPEDVRIRPVVDESWGK